MTGTRHFAVTLLRSAALCAEGVTEIVKIGLAYPAKCVELVVG